MKKLVLVSTLALALMVAALAGAATTLRISADPRGGLKFTKKALVAEAGKVTISMANPSVLPHNVAIKRAGLNVKGKVVSKGGISTVTAVLKRGTYRFYCSVPGHEAAGMWGTLVVK